MWSFFVRVIARGRARVERCRLSRRAPVADLILTRRRVRRTRSDAPRDADAAGGRAVHASARVQQPEAREREGHDHGEPHAMRSRAREVSGARGRVTFVNSKFAKSARKRFISSKDFIPLVIDGMGRMCKEFLAFQKQVAMKQTRRYDSYYVGGLSEKDAAAYVAKIKRYNIARIQILHRIWVVRRALGYTHVSERIRGEANTPGAGALVFTQPR